MTPYGAWGKKQLSSLSVEEIMKGLREGEWMWTRAWSDAVNTDTNITESSDCTFSVQHRADKWNWLENKT